MIILVSASKKRARGAVIFLVLNVMAGGCAQTNPTGEVGAFAEATSSYAVEAQQAYQTINRVTIERRVADLATESDPNVLGKELVDAKTLQNKDTLSPFLDGVALETRLALLSSLRNYANALGELSSANYKKDIDAAAQELGGTFQSLSSTLAAPGGSETPLSAEEAGAITAAVSAFGNAIVEQKRRSAIKEVVIQYNPLIQRTSRVLASGEWDALGDLQKANYETLYVEDVKAYQKEYPALSNTARRQRLRQISESYAAVRGAPIFFNDLKKASAKVGDAHQALFNAVSSNNFTSQDIVKQISELGALLKSLSAFRTRFENQH